MLLKVPRALKFSHKAHNQTNHPPLQKRITGMLDDQRYYKEQNGSVENLKLKIFIDRAAKY